MEGDRPMMDATAWYVIRSKPRREEYAQDQLRRRGVLTFLPRILEPARCRLEPVVGPLFPGYLFARLCLASQFTRVIWTPGVRSLVAFGEEPTPVDPAVIQFIQERCGAAGIVQALPTFHHGDCVRVKTGPMEGLVGIVDGSVSAQRRVQVLMELLRRRTRVSVPVEMIEHASL
jgi:transcriptional antiterminator RfaH